MSQLIMVVANNEALLHFYHTFLTSHGYKVYTQSDFRSGYSAAVVVEPQLIVIELLLDDAGEGLDLLAQLRAEVSPFTSIPLILSSTHHKFTQGLENSLHENENTRLISKAFNPRLVLTAINTLLTKYCA